MIWRMQQHEFQSDSEPSNCWPRDVLTGAALLVRCGLGSARTRQRSAALLFRWNIARATQSPGRAPSGAKLSAVLVGFALESSAQKWRQLELVPKCSEWHQK